MKIAIYSPYLDTLGGGERYMLTIAEYFSQSHDVDVLLDTHLIQMEKFALKDKLSNRFNLNLQSVNLVPAPIGKNSTFLARYFFLREYDLLISLTDGSIFYSSAKRSILHVQTPLSNNNLKETLWGRIKLSSWSKLIYNSYFTKSHAEKYWPITSQVIYPPVDVAGIKPLVKRKYILNVGRFFGYLKEKKHEVMIKAFKELVDSKHLSNWKLIIVGSAGEGDEEYVDGLKELANGYPIEILTNLAYEKLVILYGEASIYWHAMGYGETDPIKMEHFGITTVEAMAGGTVPIVIKKGGQVEIVKDAISGFLWEEVIELQRLTLKVATDREMIQKMSKKARKESKNYSKEIFCKRLDQVL